MCRTLVNLSNLELNEGFEKKCQHIELLKLQLLHLVVECCSQGLNIFAFLSSMGSRADIRRGQKTRTK